MATFGKRHFFTPIDCRLYLPEEWTKDKEGCEKSKIPKSQIVFKTKHEQALELIFRARENGLRFKGVDFDGFCGDNPEFLRKLAGNGEESMADIHCDHRIYYEDPNPVVSSAKSKQGRKPTKLKAQTR